MPIIPFPLEAKQDEHSLSAMRQSLSQCEGSIDKVNRNVFPDTALSMSNTLVVSGWLAENPSKGILPETVYVTLTDGQGKRLYIETEKEIRTDLVNSFSQITMQDAGYEVYVDISNLKSMYTLGLAYSNQDILMNCKNFSIQINIESNNP